MLKKQFLDEKRLVPAPLGTPRSAGLTGQAWYTQSASRAVNQAVRN